MKSTRVEIGCIMIVFIALGADVEGTWGSPTASLPNAMARLRIHASGPIRQSHVYATPAIGGNQRRTYANAVMCMQTDISPRALLKLLKSLEREAGRRPAGRWASRPLDLDIVSYGTLINGWPPRPRQWQRLSIPHARAHERAFVLIPLAEIAPEWRHPVLGVTAEHLLKRAGKRVASQRRRIRLHQDVTATLTDPRTRFPSPTLGSLCSTRLTKCQ
ncbi:MAG: 2-amino-4-hydroxy-6-hydroxymethyldihydropteridine diphosphokinase [Hyphomicrobiaceae bacterium]